MEPVEHLERFGLECDPFRNEPQLEFWFSGRPHVAAGRRLRRCVEQGKELCVLIGPVGSGTTTVARALAEQLDPEAFEVALVVPLRGVDPDGLRAMIARQLGVESPAPERNESMRQLYAHLVALRASGRRVVIGIDEAHTPAPGHGRMRVLQPRARRAAPADAAADRHA
jgi:MSHA biogenesis protein MshM